MLSMLSVFISSTPCRTVWKYWIISYRASSADQEVPFAPLFSPPFPSSLTSTYNSLGYDRLFPPLFRQTHPTRHQPAWVVGTFSPERFTSIREKFCFRIAIKVLRHVNKFQFIVASDLVPDRLNEIVIRRSSLSGRSIGLFGNMSAHWVLMIPLKNCLSHFFSWNIHVSRIMRNLSSW